MSKAILLLDKMPRKCHQCHYCHGYYTCLLYGGSQLTRSEMLKEFRPIWCPLQELPSFENNITDEDIENLPDDYEQSAEYLVGYENGWNDCLQAILSEEG